MPMPFVVLQRSNRSLILFALDRSLTFGIRGYSMTRLSAFAGLTAGVIRAGFSLATRFMSGQVQTAKHRGLKLRQGGGSGCQIEARGKVVLL